MPPTTPVASAFVPETNPVEWSPPQFRAALKQASEGIIDARGVRLSSDQLKRLLGDCPRDPEHPDRRQLRGADFSDATLTGDADFSDTMFAGDADFSGTIFKGRAGFGGVTLAGRPAVFTGNANFTRASFQGEANFFAAAFEGKVNFRDAIFRDTVVFPAQTFPSEANFSGATFEGEGNFFGAKFRDFVDFSNATFQRGSAFTAADFRGPAQFVRTTFQADSDFGIAKFQDEATFINASFQGDARFGSVTVQGSTSFYHATFEGEADFVGATFQGDADFLNATFGRARTFGPALFLKSVLFDHAVFVEQVTLQLSAPVVSFGGAAFRGGADLLIRWAVVNLADADFAGPSLVASLSGASVENTTFLGREAPTNLGWLCRIAESPSGFAPRLISLRRAKVGNLELSGVDLQACRFEGAHGLDRMRLEFVQFAETPASWQWRRFPWRWTRRQALAEEHQWRHSERQQDGWYADDLRLAGEEIGPLAPERIAEIYRMLRKGREDSKDEPGAADFYYGEMEMRRQKPERAARAGSVAGSEGLVTRSAGWGERLTLSLYWLVSGYGLRASRALFALAVTIALGAVLLDLFGFEPQRGPANGTLLFSLESSVSLLRAPEAELTAGGEVIQIVLRLAGPLFFGLTLLSLRGRVKR